MSDKILNEKDRALLFLDARTANAWLDRPVKDSTLQEIYDLMKFGPTAANNAPLRIVFVKTPEAKEKLKPCLMAGNVEKTMNAPVTAIFAWDVEFYEHLPKLFPHADARSWYAGNDTYIQEDGFRNGTLQAAYFMLAARGMGLSCGPMGGFDQQKVNEAFFAGTTYKSNFLCNLGYGDFANVHPRLPRFDFDAVCRIV